MTGRPDQRDADHGRAARRRWRELFDTALPGIIVCLVVILAVLAVLSVGVFTNASKTETAATAARAAIDRALLTARNGCERVQLIRDDVNVIAWGVVNALRDAPAGTRFSRIRSEQRYLPPTNCKQAPKNPRYRFPQPVPFEQVAACYDPHGNPRIEGGECPRP